MGEVGKLTPLRIYCLWHQGSVQTIAKIMLITDMDIVNACTCTVRTYMCTIIANSLVILLTGEYCGVGVIHVR